MEMAAALFMAGGTAAAGTAAGGSMAAVAGTAATAATTATAVSSSLSILQGVTTAASVLGTLTSGLGAFTQGKAQAGEAEMAGHQAEMESDQRVLRLRREMLMKQGAARVAFAASGVDISSGSAAAVDDALEGEANYETAIERRNSQAKQAASGARAAGYRRRGSTSLLSSVFKAGGQTANYGMSIARRG